ncbi:peptidoglycan DD-metalloendopeptidase family protein [Cecembia rubra]|uniref:Peptidase M23-like protein n=1 Tax=Cecembia rubra TaxID=1485585 RepID=A0A2P8E0T1_9BACT|nr:peptidoglycan DD-metalloendopeptidase family protein [Cecembia rubra]PSL03007.1 peptidase M23-like protein [Cecembia rubra]
MRFSLLFLFFLGYSTVFAQVKLESEQDKDGNVTIYANNTEVIPYTLVVDFSTLMNLTSSGGRTVFAVVNPGRSIVARLKKTNANQGSSYNYSTKLYKGSYLDKSKEEPFYLIPVQEGQKVRMQPMTHVENVYKKESENTSYVGTAFYLEESTTICAPRKGIVSDMKMDTQQTGTNLSFNASDNFIEIYHDDGTFTKLIVLESGSEKVKIGDIVYPGQALASSSGEKYSSGKHVRMVQSRLNKVDREIRQELIPVKLFDGEKEVSSKQAVSELISSHPENLISKEMSKKELKRLESK